MQVCVQEPEPYWGHTVEISGPRSHTGLLFVFNHKVQQNDWGFWAHRRYLVPCCRQFPVCRWQHNVMRKVSWHAHVVDPWKVNIPQFLHHSHHETGAHATFSFIACTEWTVAAPTSPDCLDGRPTKSKLYVSPTSESHSCIECTPKSENLSY